MTKISAVQIEEILADGYGLLVVNGNEEGVVKAALVKEDGFGRVVQHDQEFGSDIGELVNELHARL